MHEIGERGVAPCWTLAALATLIEMGTSVVIAAAGAGVGKSTLLTALLEAVPPRREIRFLPPDPMPPPSESSRHVTIISGEMSPHHPAYLWGDDLVTVVAQMMRGAQFLTTAHANDGLAVGRILINTGGSPLTEVHAQLPIVVVLRPDCQAKFSDHPLSRIDAIWRLSAHAGELIQTNLITGDLDRDVAMEQIIRAIPSFTIDRCIAWERHIMTAPAAPRDRDRPRVMLDRAERERSPDCGGA